MAWASPLNATNLFVFSTLVLIATGFVTWRFKRGVGARAPKSSRAPARTPPAPTQRRGAHAVSAAKREPFMPPPGEADGEQTDRMPLQFMPPQPASQRARFAAATAEPASSARPPGAGSAAVYIGSVNLNPAPAPVPAPAPIKRAAPTTARRPAIEGRTAQALAEDFMQWIRESRSNRSLQINTPSSALHFTDAGMVLVYPAIFQAYGGACAPPALKGAAANTQRIQAVLNAVCGSGWHESGPFESRLLHFELLQHRAAPVVIKGVLIQSPQRFITPLPPPNPALSRLL